MITWLTVWVLTVSYAEMHSEAGAASYYQLEYATQSICEKQRVNHIGSYKSSRCDFKQVPIWIPKGVNK